MTETTSTPELDSGLEIAYGHEALEGIRRRTAEEVACGRTVGGLLLGERAGAKVRILGSEELRFSAEEIRRVRQRILGAGTLPVIGWYMARPTGELILTPAELAVFHALFPTEWQITLLLIPAAAKTDGSLRDGSMQAAFFYRDADGSLVRTDGKRRQVETSDTPLPAPPPPHPASPPAPAPIHERPTSRLMMVFGWVLIAIVSLLAGAAVYEYRSRQAITVEVPHATPAAAEIPY